MHFIHLLFSVLIVLSLGKVHAAILTLEPSDIDLNAKKNILRGEKFQQMRFDEAKRFAIPFLYLNAPDVSS